MRAIDVGERVPYRRDDPFFQTTPENIDDKIRTFCLELGGLNAAYVPVRPAPQAETGWCHRNVADQIARAGGRAAYGWALWKNRIVLLAEFHAVWISPSGETIDVTPAAEGEENIVFAADENYPDNFDFARRPLNRAKSIVARSDPAAVAQAIETLSTSRRAYEERRAAKKGTDLSSRLAAKAEPSELAKAVDDLIHYREIVDRLVLPTSSRVLSIDPEAFLIAQSRIMEHELRIRRMLADKS
jgi:hypothetical protein